jgi:hypothetical protein
MERRRITDADDALTFIKGGNSRFTLVSPKTGTRFTYRVSKPKDGDKDNFFFVSLLNGPNNETDYTYVGIIANNQIRLTKKSKVGADAPSYKALDFTLRHLLHNNLPVEFWHEGKCCRCGRTLTVPESIDRGIGPECIKHI